MIISPLHPLAAAALLAAALLAGCVPGLTTTPETRFYVLGAMPPESAALEGVPREPPATVDLASVAIPQYLQRPQIVTRASANQLVLAEFDQWGGSLEKNISSVLAANLALLLDTSDIYVDARRRPVGTHVRLEVEVMRFERGPDGRVRLQAQWRLYGPDRDSAPLVSQVSTFASAPLDAAGLERTVAAMSELLGELSVQVARAVVAAPRG